MNDTVAPAGSLGSESLPWTQRGTIRSVAQGLLHAVLLLGLAAFVLGAADTRGVAVAAADEEVDLALEPDWVNQFDATAAAYRARFLKVGTGASQWSGLLSAMEKAEDSAAAVEAVLGPLLDPDGELAGRSEGNRNKLLVRVISSLLQRKLEDPEASFILADEMMRCFEAYGETLLSGVLAELPEDLKTGERLAWRRLVQHALDRVTNVPKGPFGPAIYSSAVWVLGRAPEVDGFRALESLLQIVQRKPSAISGSPLAQLGEDTLKQALTALLGRSWRDLATVSTWADQPAVKAIRKSAGTGARNETIFKDYIRLLKNLLQLPSDAQVLAAKYGQQLAQERSSLEGLKELMYPGLSPIAEVRRAAMARAGELAPEATAEWVDVLVRVLEEESDHEVVRRLLNVIAQPGFAKKTEHTPMLVDALVARLVRQDGTTDPLDIRRKLVEGIAGLGGSRGLWDSIRQMKMLVYPPDSPRPREEHLVVYLELIERASQAEGTLATNLAQLWFREGGDDPVAAPASVRRIVAEGLRRDPVRTKTVQRKIAGALLRVLLEGHNGLPEVLEGLTLPDFVGGEQDESVRATLIASLRYYPSDETVKVLAEVLKTGSTSDLGAAVEALAAIIEKGASAPAAEALMALYTEERPQVREHRLRILRAFAAVPAEEGTAALRERLCSFARGLLVQGVGRPEALLATLDILVGCGDAESLPAALARWRAESEREGGEPDPWRAGTQKLALAAAARGAEHDAAVLAALTALAAVDEGEGPETAAAEQSLARSLATQVFEATKRAAYIEFRIERLVALRDDATAESAVRVKAGTETIMALREMGAALEGDAAAGAYERAYTAALALGALGEVEGWFLALDVATKGGVKALVLRALGEGPEGEAKPLQVLQETADLGEDAVARWKASEEELQALKQKD